MQIKQIKPLNVWTSQRSSSLPAFGLQGTARLINKLKVNVKLSDCTDSFCFSSPQSTFSTFFTLQSVYIHFVNSCRHQQELSENLVTLRHQQQTRISAHLFDSSRIKLKSKRKLLVTEVIRVPLYDRTHILSMTHVICSWKYRSCHRCRLHNNSWRAKKMTCLGQCVLAATEITPSGATTPEEWTGSNKTTKSRVKSLC